jgi:hypothetical protein
LVQVDSACSQRNWVKAGSEGHLDAQNLEQSGFKVLYKHPLQKELKKKKAIWSQGSERVFVKMLTFLLQVSFYAVRIIWFAPLLFCSFAYQ